MKKMLVAIILMCILISGKVVKNDFTLLDYFDGEYYAFTEEKMPNSVFVGNCYMTKNLKDTANLVGESIKVKNLEISAAIKELKAQVVKTDYLENGVVVIYAFSPFITKSIKCANKKVNLEFAQFEDFTVVGWPTILNEV